MKPRYRRFTHAALPALIVIPALMHSAYAGIATQTITPNPAGNILVAGNYDEIYGTAWTVLASGGSTSPFTATIQQGASLTGDLSLRNGIEVTSTAYTINNAGSLNVDQYGIISYVGGTVINNQAGGLIQGAYDGINLNSERRKSHNVDSAPLKSGTVVNDGAIIGNYNGISAQSGLVLTNNESGEITANFGTGVSAGDDLQLTNHGTITGNGNEKPIVGKSEFLIPVFNRGGNGVDAGSNASLTNYGSITGNGGNGVNSYNRLSLTNYGSITGNGAMNIEANYDSPYGYYPGSGVTAGDDATIRNKSDGTISGTFDGIRAGSNLILTNSGRISGSSEGNGRAGVSASDGAIITNDGQITGDAFGITINNDQMFQVDYVVFNEVDNLEMEIVRPTTVDNTGTITGSQAAILLQGGDDVVNLGFGSTINGNISGGRGNDHLNFSAGSQSITDIRNIVHGNVEGIETITKSGPGFAFIGGPGESFNVVTDTIQISSGGLIINGNLSSLSEGKTQITLSGDGQLDGTGTWNADLTIGSGGISAGSTVNQLAGSDEGVVPLLFSKRQSETASSTPVGTLMIHGNVTHTAEQIEPAASLRSAPLAAAPPVSSYIREDIMPQTTIIDGTNSDLIVQNGGENTYNLTGADIRISPTDINKTLTDGTYTIIDSDSPLVGVKDLGTLGVQFHRGAPETGPFFANQRGENNLNTVLTQFFTTVETTDPVTQEEPPTTERALATPTDPDDSNLVINIKHNYQGLPGLSQNQSALGGAIDSSINSSNPLIQDFIAALDYSDLAAVQSTLAKLDPSNTLGLTTVVMNSNYRLHRLTQEHLAAIRGNGKVLSETAASTKDAKGGIVPGQTTTRSIGRGNAWGSMSYDGQDYDANTSSADFDGNSGAYTAGFDWLVAPQLVLGVVLDGSRGDFDGQDNSSDVDSFRGAAYGTWGASKGFYSDAILGFGNHSLDSKLTSGGILGRSISSDTDANSFQAMATVGYTMGDERVKHGPFAGLEYQQVDVDGFTQSGPLPIQVSGYDVDSLRGLIGYRVNANFGTLRPYASVAYAQEFENGNNSTTASFGGVPFKVTGADQSSSVIISIGTGISLSDMLSLDVGYRGDIATGDGLTSNGGSLGLNLAF